MDYKVGFEDKTVIFTRCQHAAPQGVTLYAADAIDRTKVLKILRNCNSLNVVCPDPGAAYELFRGQFRVALACGGVVSNPKGETLMILRANRWDLPKGHLEEDESPRQCAVREVEEECGITGPVILGELPATRHIYKFRGRWTLKECRWYAMRYDGNETPMPQTEEGIGQAVWTRDPADLTRDSFANIRETLAAHGAWMQDNKERI